MVVELKAASELKYLTMSQLTDWSTLGRAIGAVRSGLQDVFRSNGLERVGPETLVYRFTNDPNQPEGKHGRFEVGAQWAWSESEVDEADLAPALVTHWGGEPYVMQMYRGAVDPRLPWDKVRDAAEASGHVRTLVEREVYHRLDGFGDPGNIIELQCFVQARL